MPSTPNCSICLGRGLVPLPRGMSPEFYFFMAPGCVRDDTGALLMLCVCADEKPPGHNERQGEKGGEPSRSGHSNARFNPPPAVRPGGTDILTRGASVFKEPREPTRRELGIDDRVLDLDVSQVILDSTGIESLSRKVVSACVSEHMWMGRESQVRDSTGPRHDQVKRSFVHRATVLGREHVSLACLGTRQLAQGSQLGLGQLVQSRLAALCPTHLDPGLIEVNLIPEQAHNLGASQPVPEA